MIRDTYKGRQLKAVKGKSFGKSRIFVNGVDRGEWLGTEADQIESAKRTIDDVESRPFEGRWSEEWYAPGTYELNEHGHVVAPGGVCSCDYCATRRGPAAKVQNRVSIDDIVTKAKATAEDIGADLGSATPMTIERLPLQANGHLISRKAEVEVLRFDGREPYVSGAAYRCAVCDRRPIFRVTDNAVHVQEPCPYPDGITTKITIDVLSGKLLVTDDLRPVFNWDDNAIADYNSTLGQAQAVEAMAAVGCAYGPVGNSCPGLYRTGPDSYIIASPRYDDDDNPSLPESSRLAGICTDLWAYSIADLEHWKAQGGDPASLGWSDAVVDVPPGTYQFIHHSGERGFDRDAAETVTFAHVERIA